MKSPSQQLPESFSKKFAKIVNISINNYERKGVAI